MGQHGAYAVVEVGFAGDDASRSLVLAWSASQDVARQHSHPPPPPPLLLLCP